MHNTFYDKIISDLKLHIFAQIPFMKYLCQILYKMIFTNLNTYFYRIEFYTFALARLTHGEMHFCLFMKKLFARKIWNKLMYRVGRSALGLPPFRYTLSR